ncbi:MAG: AMP-dependent synthetase/ligase [Sphingomonadales bacterium]
MIKSVSYKSSSIQNNKGHNWENLVSMFFDQAEQLKDKPFLWAKSEGIYIPTTWAEAAKKVTKIANALKKQGVKFGDRVVILSESRPEWCLSDIAIMSLGAISVPAYTTNTEADHLHILQNSAAKGAIVSKDSLAKNFFPAAHKSNSLTFIFSMEEPIITQKLDINIFLWDKVVEEENHNIEAYKEAAKSIKSSDTSCIIYTSGTGGSPKGVMLHHGAILHNCEGAKDVVLEIGLSNDRFLSFLPLSHAYEHSAGQFLPIYIGAEIYYAESMERLAQNLIEARPTIMMVVPRLFEMFKNKIITSIKKESGIKKRLFFRALTLGRKHFKNPNSLTLVEKIENNILEAIIRRAIRKKFGGSIKALVSGGAALNKNVGTFFLGLGLPVLQGYGQTESAPFISVNRPSKIKVETVGPPLKNTSVKIAEDGEILVKGELVTFGYWRDKASTEEILKDGWLHTGDIGIIDEDGHIKITDRKKDIIVLDKGHNVSPQRIEGVLSLQEEISQAMVYGDKKPHLVALIVPESEWLIKWAHDNNKPNRLQDLKSDKDLHRALAKSVGQLNSTLSNLERVRKFTIANEAFTIENEQMTPTLKIRRHVISELYRNEIEGLY